MYEAVNLKDKRSKEMEQSLVAPDKLYHKSIFGPSSLLSGFGEKDGMLGTLFSRERVN